MCVRCLTSASPAHKFEPVLPLRPASPFAGLLAIAGWIAVEILAFNLVASVTGGGVAFFLLVMKSVLGMIFVQRAVRQKLFSMLREGAVVIEGGSAARAFARAMGGFLLIVPGFAAGLAGLVLMAPPVLDWIGKRAAARDRNPRDIDLGSGDWREVPREPQGRIDGPQPPRSG